MAIDIKLPPLGDNIASGDVLEVKVQVGDVIEKEQGIIEIETDKATVEVPSTHAGKVLQVHVRDGQTIPIGASLITVEEEAGAAGAPPAAEGTPSAKAPTQQTPTAKAPAKPAAAAPSTPAPQAKEAPRPAHPAAPSQPAAKPTAPAAATPAARQMEPEVRPEPEQAEEAVPAAQGNGMREGSTTGAIPAGPSVRRFAREVGVDLAGVTGSGPGGRILREDVLAVVRSANEAARERAMTFGEAGGQAIPTERDAWGPVRSEKMPKIRKTIAAKMAESWSTAPRVTNFDDADVTELERIRQSSKDDYAADGIKLTALPFVIKAVAMSLKKHPTINATLDMEEERLIYKQYVNIGVAVDTERGLVVPVLRHADKLSIPEIAKQLAALAENVRSGNFGVDDLRGSTFTISNLGAVGGTYSTPMINVPEVAILLLGRSRKMPVVIDDKVAIRLMMPLSLSYDHRLVDGAAAARFLNDVRGLLEAPSRLLLAP